MRINFGPGHRVYFAPLDVSSYLDNQEVIAEYLTAAAEDENPAVLLTALANVAKARGMAHVAEAAGLGRESLYKALAPGAQPRFHTVQAVLRALNVRIAMQPTPASPASTKLAANKRKLRNEAAKKTAAKGAALAKRRA